MKKYKYIMELVFIFILPLIFILFNVNINNDIEYDNEGNYKIVNTNIEYNSILYVQEEITTYSLQHYTTWDLDSYTGDIYMAYDDFIYHIEQGSMMLAWNGSDKENISIYLSDSTTIIFNDEAYNQYHEETCTIVTIDSVDYYKVSVTNFTYDIPNEEWEFNRGYYLMTASISYKDSPIASLINTLYNLIQVDTNNQSLQVIIDYSFLWFLDFIIWHLIYMFVDFLLHFWRKEEK